MKHVKIAIRVRSPQIHETCMSKWTEFFFTKRWNLIIYFKKIWKQRKTLKFLLFSMSARIWEEPATCRALMHSCCFYKLIIRPSSHNYWLKELLRSVKGVHTACFKAPNHIKGQLDYYYIIIQTEKVQLNIFCNPLAGAGRKDVTLPLFKEMKLLPLKALVSVLHCRAKKVQLPPIS